ncbi:MAG TPA: transcription antitermination factor NusB [Candidatus Cloacimonadota bacterium]|nr:transcription antitermination factor NusB [Candidatus Cloacimonadota bacterium]
MSFRRKSRELVVQTLYALGYEENDDYLQELELINKYEEKLLLIAEDRRIDEKSQIYTFAHDLLKDLIIAMNKIDHIINEYSIGWSTERIAKVDLCIMRLAVFEIIFYGTPAPVVINESVEISKKFCSETSAPFINAVLDAVFQNQEKISKD